MHGLETQYCEDVNFAYLDIDNPDTLKFKEALGYIYQPHIFLLDADGNILNQWVGYVQGAELESAITAALSQ